MGNRRRLVLIGLVIVAAAIAAGVFLMGPSGNGGGQPAEVEETQEPEPQVEILVAANNLSQGMVISEDYVQLWPWNADQLPQGYYTNPAEVAGYVVRVDLIPQGMPLMPSMLARSLAEVGGMGGDFARTVPAGKRAYAIPMDLLGGLAWNIETGDHVDVLISWNIVDLDEELQTSLPNQYVCVGGETECQGIYGRMEVLPTGQTIMVYNPETPRDRYIAQVTIQDALVLAVGEFEIPEPTDGAATRPEAEPTPEGGEGTGEEGQPAGTPESPTRGISQAQVVILGVSPQDTLVLKAATELQADIDLALRTPEDTEVTLTDPVSVDYIMAQYGITPPPRLPYGVEAPGISPVQEQAVEGTVGEQPAETTGEEAPSRSAE